MERGPQIIFETLRPKIQTLRDVLDHACDLQGEDIGGQLDDLWQRTFERVSGERTQRFADELERSEKILQDEDEQPLNKKERETVEFLYAIKRLIENLKRKNEQVTTVTQPPEEAEDKIVSFYQQRDASFSRADIVDWQEKEYALVVTIRPEIFERMFGRIRGVFVSGTPYCTIKQGIDNRDDVVAHELIHALSDGIVVTEKPAKHLARLLGRFNKVYEHSPEVAAIMAPNARWFLDLLHGELTAAAETAIDTVFAQAPKIGEVYSEELTTGHFVRYLEALKTAGEHTMDFFDAIKSERGTYKDAPHVLALLDSLGKDFYREFMFMGHGLDDAAQMVQRIEPARREEARKELLLLLCLLPPHQFRHAPKYLYAWYKANMSMSLAT